MSSKPRKFRGFAVIDRPDGALVWGTFRLTEKDARAAYERWNPALPDHPQAARVVHVEIRLFDKK